MSSINWLVGGAVGFIVLIVAVGIGANITGEQKLDEACATGTYFNDTGTTYPTQCCTDGTNCTLASQQTDLEAAGQVYHDGLQGETKFSGKFTLIASVVVLVFIIGLLYMLYGRRD